MLPPLTASTNVRDLVQGSRNRLRLDVLRYPPEVDETPHKFIMKFTKGIKQNRGNGHQMTNASDLFVVLPVPQKITDGINVAYSATDLGITGELISNIASSVQGQSVGQAEVTMRSGVMSALNAIRDTSNGLLSEVGTAGFTYLAGSAINQVLSRVGVSSPTAPQALASGMGRIINPFTTAIFQGVDLRKFTFSWIFSPEGPAQSVLLEKIIKRLRAKSLPTLSQNNLFMNFPPEVEFNFLGMQKDTFEFPVAPCVITNLIVDRSAAGEPVFFAGTGAPVFTSISISFMEVRPLVARGDVNDSVITSGTIGQGALSPSPSRISQQAAAALTAGRRQFRGAAAGSQATGFTENN